MRRLENRVAIITGAGRGIGREHALAMARQGAAVIVNDLGASLRGDQSNEDVAQGVVNEIIAMGGRAIASPHDVADWSQAKAMVDLAVATFGDLHVLVNNAGVLRDRTMANVEEQEWDAVVRVHLKGHAATTHHAMAYWRDRAKAGHKVQASLVHTTSISAFAGKIGQGAYAAAKLGVVALSNCAAFEGEKHGIRSNVIAPSARTRLDPRLVASGDNSFDMFDPANVSPLVAWLAEADCRATGQVFQAYGNRIKVIEIARVAHELVTEARWQEEEIDRLLPDHLLKPVTTAHYLHELADFAHSGSVQ